VLKFHLKLLFVLKQGFLPQTAKNGFYGQNYASICNPSQACSSLFLTPNWAKAAQTTVNGWNFEL